MNARRHQAGFVLIAAVFGLVLIAIMALNGTAMFVNQMHGAVNVQAMVEADAAAAGATEYLLKRLEEDLVGWADWTTLPGTATGFSLGNADFEYAFSNPEATQVDVTLTTNLALYAEDIEDNVFMGDNPSVSRIHSFTVWRLPKTLRFGLMRAGFGGEAPSDLILDDSFQITNITGDIYNDGDVTFNGSSILDGRVYMSANGGIVTPGGPDTGGDNETLATPPAPTGLPRLDLTAYHNLIATIPVHVCAGLPGSSFNLPPGVYDLTTYPGNILNTTTAPGGADECNMVIQPGTTFTGNGTVTATENVTFNFGGGIAATPSGGNIVFAAGDAVIANGSTLTFTPNTDGSRVVVFARADAGTTTDFAGPDVHIGGSLVMGYEDIMLRAGVDAAHASFDTTIMTLGPNCQLGGPGCRLTVTSNTTVVEGSLISEDALTLSNFATVRGLVYAGVAEGGLEPAGVPAGSTVFIQNAIVTGAMMVNNLWSGGVNGRVEGLRLTYNQENLPGMKANGARPNYFDTNDSTAWIKPNSWRQE